VQEYFTYLYAEHPDRFEQYFTGLFLSPTSLTWAEPSGFYPLYAAFMQVRLDLSNYLGQNTTRVPDNAAMVKSLQPRIQRILQSFQQMVLFNEKYDLMFTFQATFTNYGALLQQRLGAEVPGDLVARVQHVQFMFAALTLFASFLPFVTALNDVLTTLNSYALAFTAVKNSGFTDQNAARALFRTAQLSPLDRRPFAAVPPPYNTLVSLENQLCNYVDDTINEWRKFSDLPFAPPVENIPLYLEVLKHLYDTSLARGTVVSQEISYVLVKQFQTKMKFFDTGTFQPRTAVVYMSTHGGLLLQPARTDTDAQAIRVAKKVVPENVVVTRVTFAPPGAVVHARESELSKFAELIQGVIADNPEAVNRPMNFVFALIDKLHRERKEQGLEPDKFEDENDEEGVFNPASEFFSSSFMRPEAVMYLPGEKYLNKKYQISAQEKREGNRTIELITAQERTNVLDKNYITLDALIEGLASPPLNYNNLIFIDQTSNVFSSKTKTFDFLLLQKTSRELVQQGFLGGRK